MLVSDQAGLMQLVSGNDVAVLECTAACKQIR
jgi:hypothetical protein